jgi:mono/diheme cytochrome c family protein
MRLPVAMGVLAATLLAGGCSHGTSPGGDAAAALPPDGARIYAGNCIACHQQDGRGIPGVYPALAGSAVVAGDPVALAAWVVHGSRPPGMPVGRYSMVMPQFPWLRAADAAALLTYLRGGFGNQAGAVDAATLAPVFQ